ncbi:MAG: DUF898 family protein [Lautropia sp.]|nr:DUF898 family protein [Lautropia sp.]
MSNLVVGRYNPLPPGGVGIRFSGRGWDYFRIWAGDMFFMMLTLGFYWPWMRRRRWQFLNANTWVGNIPLGDARLMTAPGSWPHWLHQLILALGLFALWRLTRPYGLIGWVWMALLFSLSGPWWLRNDWRGRFGQLYWQGEQIRFNGTLPGACRSWVLMCLSLLPCALMAMAFVLDASGAGIVGMEWSVSHALSETVRTVLFWCVALSVVLGLAGWYYHALRYGLRHIVHPVYPFQSRLRFWPLLRAATVAVLLVLPVPFLVIGLVYANWPLLLATLSIEPPGTLQTLVALAPAADTLLGGLRMDGASMQGADVCVGCRALVVIGLVGLACLIVLMGWRYFMARAWNQSWRTLSLPGGHVESRLPAGRLMVTGFFCDVLIVLTAGLYYPFAVVRMARLRRESLRVMPVYAVDGGLPGEQHLPGGAWPDAPAGGLPGREDRAAAHPRPRLPWALALVMIIVPMSLLVLGMSYGKPMLARSLARAMPAQVSDSIGEGALSTLRRQGLQPSALSAEEQDHWRTVLSRGLAQAWPRQKLPAHRIEFAQGGALLGANALALPNGVVLLTDELLALAVTDPDTAQAVLVGILASEVEHLRLRHAEQALVLSYLRVSAWNIATGRGLDELVELGVASVLQQGYSQRDEQVADQVAVATMRAMGQSPAPLVRLLRRLQAEAMADPGRAVAARNVPIGMASQPLDTRRLRLFRPDGATD